MFPFVSSHQCKPTSISNPGQVYKFKIQSDKETAKPRLVNKQWLIDYTNYNQFIFIILIIVVDRGAEHNKILKQGKFECTNPTSPSPNPKKQTKIMKKRKKLQKVLRITSFPCMLNNTNYANNGRLESFALCQTLNCIWSGKQWQYQPWPALLWLSLALTKLCLILCCP